MRTNVAFFTVVVVTGLIAAAAFPGCDCGGPVSEGESEGEEGEGEGDGGEGEGDANCTVDGDCVDNDLCTTDRCVGGACVHGAAGDGTPCGSNPCAGNAACVAGACTEGVAPDLDVDNDGVPTAVCGGGDCDDNDASIHPGALEGPTGDATCSDGKDNDCDGGADSLDSACGATELCFDDGWCWENPRPHGFALNAVWPFGPNDVWVGAQSQGGVAHYDGSGFAVQVVTAQGGFPAAFLKMFGNAPNDVWAAGGSLLHYDGNNWSVDNASAGLGQFLDVWGFGSHDVWTIGGNGTAAHYDGIAWTAFSLASTESFTALHGLATDDLWAVGQGPLAGHFDGTRWTTEVVNDAANFFLDAVWEAAPGDVWAGGDVGVMWHRENGTWVSVPAVPNHRVTGLAGAAPDDIWAVGDSGLVFHWNGDTWGQAASFPPQQLSGMRMHAPDDIWAVGGAGLIIHFDGTSWTRVAVPERPVDGTVSDVVSVAGANGLEAWAFGAANAGGALVARRDRDGIWQTEENVPPAAAMQAAVAIADDDVWAVGTGALHWNGAAWSAVSLPGNNQGHDVCGDAADDLWVAGSNTVMHGNGTSFTVDATFNFGSSFDAPSLARVFCVGDGDVWAGGANLLLHRDPTSGAWSELGTSRLGGITQFRVASAGPDDLWVVDNVDTSGTSTASTLLHYDGVDWSRVDLGLSGRVLDVADLAGDVWLSGSGGLLAHLDAASPGGGAFQAIATGVGDDLRNVRPIAGGHVMVVSDQATYEYDGVDFTAKSTSSSGTFQDVYFASDVFGFAVDGNSVRRWNGADWNTFESIGGFNEPRTIWGFAADDVWVGGEGNAAISHFDGQNWTEVELTDTFPDAVTDIWGSAPDDVWAVADEFFGTSRLWHNTGGGFAPVGDPFVPDRDNDLFGLYATSSTDLWVFGQFGTFDQLPLVVRGDGTDFSRFLTLDSPGVIQKVGDRLLAVDGEQGVWERTASGWSAIALPRLPDDPSSGDLVTSGSFTSDTSGFFFSQRGGVQRFDGTSLFLDQQPGFGLPVSSISGSASGDFFGGGFGSNILHRAP